MDEYGLTDAGFVIPTFDDVLNNYMTALKNTFGADAATSEDTVFGQLFRIIAYTDYTLWEGMQGVYNTQTLDGAEGIYLDEIFLPFSRCPWFRFCLCEKQQQSPLDF